MSYQIQYDDNLWEKTRKPCSHHFPFLAGVIAAVLLLWSLIVVYKTDFFAEERNLFPDCFRTASELTDRNGNDFLTEFCHEALYGRQN